MKNNLKYRLSALLFLASALTMTSCSDWTDVESLQLNTPTFEEQNPQLYADYLKDLNRYKSEEHKFTFVSFENPQGSPGILRVHLLRPPRQHHRGQLGA